MKSFKKYVVLFLSVLMLISLSACGKSATSSSTTKTPENSTPSGTDTKYSPDVQAIIDRGVLRVGVKNAVIGFGYQDPDKGILGT